MHARTNSAAARCCSMEQCRSAGAQHSRTSGGLVVLHLPTCGSPCDRHEIATHADTASRLAALKGFQFAGEFDAAISYPGPLYFVPTDTLLNDEASVLGIDDELDLF